MQFEYTVRIKDDQIKQVDALIKNHLKYHPEASADDALDLIFTIGVNVLEAVNYLPKPRSMHFEIIEDES